MDGTALYQVIAVFFLAQLFAIELSFLLIIFKLLPEFKLSFLRDKMIFTVKPIQPEKLENLQ